MGIFSFYKGTAEFCTKIKNPETAVNKLRQLTAIRDISISDDSLCFSCFYFDRRTAEKTITELGGEILQRKYRGFPHIMSKYRKRAGLFAGVLFSVICIFASSFFVWDVSVEGNETITDSEIIKELERTGFSIGMLKKNVDIEKCVNMLLVNEDRLSWAAINFDGTLAHVEVKEAKIAKRVEDNENVNLVASHNGIIIRVDALDGESVVEKGDAVIKGQLLVSAFVERRTGGSLLTGARGYVWANTERSYAVVVPFGYNEKKYTGNTGTKYTLNFLGRAVELPHIGKDGFEACDRTMNETVASFGENFRLPVKIKTETAREYQLAEKRRTEEQALEIARETAKIRLTHDSPDFKLADIAEQYICENDTLVYTCTFNGVENIAEKLEFVLS